MSAAVLVLEDGRSFTGRAYGALGQTLGEIVFNTGMSGYQETLTDPSYHRQIVVMTAPHIGNTGVNDEDPESGRIWVAGYVVRDPARRASSWRADRTLDDELAAQGVVGLSGIDTRALTRHLRERGVMRAGIFSGDALCEGDREATLDELRARVLAAPSMAGADLVGEVTTREPYTIEPIAAERPTSPHAPGASEPGTNEPGTGGPGASGPGSGDDATSSAGSQPVTVVAVDLGIKAMTPQRLAERGARVHVVPATTTIDQIEALAPDGVFFSNGPGDPEAATGVVELLREVLDRKIPFFGICFGNQILGRALGFNTYKLDYGHRGINQPVQDLATGKVEITSHNHGFAVDAPIGEAVRAPYDDGRYGRVRVSHVNLNDDVVEGLECLDLPAFAVQYHPEAAAGPHDAAYLFDRFVSLMRDAQGRNA